MSSRDRYEIRTWMARKNHHFAAGRRMDFEVHMSGRIVQHARAGSADLPTATKPKDRYDIDAPAARRSPTLPPGTLRRD